ncbi:MAG TPA: hypothetical protein VGG25_03040 [Streptosporangiaceae bacterium]|jgi:hypothetical protein
MRKNLTFRAQALAISGALLTVFALGAGPALGTANAAASPAISTITVCLTNASTQCADVKDDSNTAGTRIWLYDKSDANSYKWVEASDSGCDAGVACFYLEDAQNTNLCLTATGTDGAEVKLENCNDAGSWYNEGANELGNGAYGANATLITNGSANEDYLYASRTGNWHQWNW